MLEPDFRPYAATANITAVIERARTRNLPDAIGNDFLVLTGVPEAVFGRVKQALEFLHLTEEDGRPTDILHGLAKAPDSEYQGLLANCVREAYREDFLRIDPSQDPQGKITEAFRRYQPRSQTSRMVMLFLGLCRAAGMTLVDAPRERKMQPKAVGSSRVKRILDVPEPRQVASRDPRGFDLGGFFDKAPLREEKRTLFAISEEDIADIEDEDFDILWEALGKVARQRALRKKPSTSALPAAGDSDATDA